MKLYCLALFISLLLGGVGQRPAQAQMAESGDAWQPTYTLTVLVTGFSSSEGKAGVALFNAAEGFPTDPSTAIKNEFLPIRDQASTVTFTLPKGEYAISVMHDANHNRQFDTNWVGIPKEGYGTSNNAKGSAFGPPTFEAAKFFLQADTTLTIQMYD